MWWWWKWARPIKKYIQIRHTASGNHKKRTQKIKSLKKPFSRYPVNRFKVSVPLGLVWCKNGNKERQMDSSHIRIANHNPHCFFTVGQSLRVFFIVNTNPLAPMKHYFYLALLKIKTTHESGIWCRKLQEIKRLQQHSQSLLFFISFFLFVICPFIPWAECLINLLNSNHQDNRELNTKCKRMNFS